MKLTKYGHACFVVEEGSQKVIVDPGAYSELPADLENVVAVVFTHIHNDHFHLPHLEAIKAQNPEVLVFGAKEVADEVQGCIEPVKTQPHQAGSFSLKFYGDLHELARPGKPQVHNLGVCINDLIAYPGDSYTQLGKRVKVMMAPTNAPWLHIAAAYAFVFNAQADITIPTHDGLLSDIGFQVYDAHLSEAAQEAGSTYRRMAVGETLEI